MKRKLVSLFIVILSFLLFSFKIQQSFNYDNDFGRDINDIYDITQGKLRLLGPGLSFGGLISGPYYYYLFAVPMVLANRNPVSILYFNALLFAVALGATFYLFSQKFSFWPSLWFTLWLATSKYFIFSARNPGNAFSYLWLWLAFIDILLFAKTKRKKFVILGLLAGMIANFHFVNLIIFLAMAFVWLALTKKGSPVGLFSLALMLTFTPQLLFELRHNFVMIKNTFINKSYQTFTSATLPTTLKVSTNPIKNFFLIAGHTRPWLQPSLLIIIGATIIFYFGRKFEKEEKTIILATIFSYLLFVVLARFQFAFHYFLPFLLLWQTSLFLTIKDLRWIKFFPALFVFLNLLNWPTNLYRPASRKLSDFQKVVQTIIDQRLVSPEDKFNIFVVRETPLAVLGYEYRFYFKKAGYRPQGPFSYNQSEKLIVIIEKKGGVELEKIQSWELSQFGRYQIIQKKEIDNRRILLLEKVASADQN